MTNSRTWGKDLETTVKVVSIPGIPANVALWSHGGSVGKRHDTEDHEGMTSNFCVAEHMVSSLADRKALLGFSWEASTATHLGAGIWWDTPQRPAEQTEAKGPFTPGRRALFFLSLSRARNLRLTWKNPWKPSPIKEPSISRALSRQNVPLFVASTLPFSFVAEYWFYSEWNEACRKTCL